MQWLPRKGISLKRLRYWDASEHPFYSHLLIIIKTSSTGPSWKNNLYQWQFNLESTWNMSGPLLMRSLGIRKNIPVSDTKLTPGLRVGFISSHLTADKRFPVSLSAITGPLKMSLLLEAESTPALIINNITQYNWQTRWLEATHSGCWFLIIKVNSSK